MREKEEGERERERRGGRERKGGRERGREGGRKRERKREREGGREGGREGEGGAKKRLSPTFISKVTQSKHAQPVVFSVTQLSAV